MPPPVNTTSSIESLARRASLHEGQGASNMAEDESQPLAVDPFARVAASQKSLRKKVYIQLDDSGLEENLQNILSRISAIEVITLVLWFPC